MLAKALKPRKAGVTKPLSDYKKRLLNQPNKPNRLDQYPDEYTCVNADTPFVAGGSSISYHNGIPTGYWSKVDGIWVCEIL
jgi:hypothetical protein